MKIGLNWVLLLVLAGAIAGESSPGSSMQIRGMTCGENGTAGTVPGFDPPSLMATVQEYADFGSHRTGSSGEKQAAQWVGDKLKAAGFQVKFQDVPFDYFAPAAATIEAGGLKVNALPVWPPVWTVENGIKGRLLRYRPEFDETLQGAIVWVDLPFRRHNSIHEAGIAKLFATVARAGAAGIVAVTHGPTGEAVALNSNIRDFSSDVPIVLIAPKDARALAAHLAQETGATLTLTGSGPEKQTAHNVIGEIDRGGKWAVVSTPFSGWYASGAERGPGIAIFNALATWLPGAFPERSFLFVATTGHELGNLGAELFLGHAAPGPAETSLWLHLGSGLAARDFQEYGPYLLPLPSADSQRFLAGNGNSVPVLKASFRGITGLEQVHPADPATAAGELRAILAAGYQPVIGAFGAHRYHHTELDTPDKTGGSLIAPVAEGFRLVLEKLLAESSGSQTP